MRAEHPAHAAGLDGVVQLRRCAVIVDVADLFRTAARAVESCLDAPHDLDTARIHLHAVVRVTRGPVSFDPRVPGCPTGDRAVLPLEHEHPGTLPEHESVTPAIEGARRLARAVIVVGRDGPHTRESEDHPWQHTPVGASGQQHLVFARSNQRGRVPQRVGGTGTAARQHVAQAAEPQRDGDLARHHAADAESDGVRRDVATAVGEEVLVLLLADIDAAAAAANQYARVGLSCTQARVAPRLARGDGAKQRGSRIAPGIRVPFLVIVTVDRRRIVHRYRRHPRGDATRIGRDIELRDRP